MGLGMHNIHQIDMGNFILSADNESIGDNGKPNCFH